MSLKKLNQSLQKEIEELQAEGRRKTPERIITSNIPPQRTRGPRYCIAGEEKTFLRINSNNYLNLSTHPKLIAAADKAFKKFGVGPGAVRFIDGTYIEHKTLEKKLLILCIKETHVFSIRPTQPT